MSMKDDPFIRPIRPISEEERDRLKTPGIEAIRDSGEEHEAEVLQELREKVAPFAAFLLHFSTALTTMQHAGKKLFHIMKDDTLVQDLYQLHSLFIKLSEKDQSENPSFVEALSMAWSALNLHCEAIQSGRIKSGIPPQKMASLLQQIDTYPKGSEHTLGYYLKNHVGNEWLPFPLIELLRTLHRSFAVDGEKSHLSLWLREVGSLLPSKE